MLGVLALYHGLSECAVLLNTSDFSTRGFFQDYLTLSSWPVRPTLGAQGGEFFSGDPTPLLRTFKAVPDRLVNPS